MIKPKMLVLFVEGATDKVFFKYLVDFLSKKNKNQVINDLDIIDVRGIGNYNRKALAKFKYNIKHKYNNSIFIVFCAYDTDVFSFGRKPPVNWEKIDHSLKENGASEVHHIRVKTMIEDWFLLDIEGLSQYLALTIIPEIEGKDGNEKMKYLFKQGNRVYQKGYHCDKFIPYLDFEKIYMHIKNDIHILETKIFETTIS